MIPSPLLNPSHLPPQSNSPFSVHPFGSNIGISTRHEPKDSLSIFSNPPKVPTTPHDTKKSSSQHSHRSQRLKNIKKPDLSCGLGWNMLIYLHYTSSPSILAEIVGIYQRYVFWQAVSVCGRLQCECIHKVDCAYSHKVSVQDDWFS